MKKIITISGLVCFLFLVSCKKESKSTLDYGELAYDSARITIFKWDTLYARFPKNSNALPLSQSDLQVVDSLLRQSVDSFNKVQNGQVDKLVNAFSTVHDPELFLLNLIHFKIEYIPYQDVNWIDRVDVNCYCDGTVQSKKYEVVWGKRRNYCHFQITIDLKRRKASALFIDYNFG